MNKKQIFKHEIFDFCVRSIFFFQVNKLLVLWHNGDVKEDGIEQWSFVYFFSFKVIRKNFSLQSTVADLEKYLQSKHWCLEHSAERFKFRMKRCENNLPSNVIIQKGHCAFFLPSKRLTYSIHDNDFTKIKTDIFFC